MRSKSTSNTLFRLFAITVAVVMAFSQVAGVVRAQSEAPGEREKVDVPPVSLDEVQSYFNTVGNPKGPVGVVVELEDQPAALIYAQSSGNQVTAATIDQINLIQQKQEAFMGEMQAADIQATELFRTQKVYNGIYILVDRNDLEKIASIAGVKAIHPIIAKTFDTKTSVPLINAPQVWGGTANFQGEGIKIGIIDTGIDYIHFNFGGDGIYVGQDFTTLDEAVNAFPTTKVVGGYDFVGDAYNANPNSASYDPIPAPDPDPMDCYGHGSHVAGITAGLGVTKDGATYVESGTDTYANLKNLTQSDYTDKFLIGPGVAPKALLYSLRVFGCAGSTDVTDQAIEWAMDPNNDGDLSDHLDVINMSLGSAFGSIYDTTAVASNNAAQAGVIVVAASGNAGDVYYITDSPAVASNAISVASSLDASSVVSAFEVTANTAAAPLVPPGLYPAALAAFGPETFNQPGDLFSVSPGDQGCDTTPYPAGTFTGKIALINRGGCTFVEKVKNAQDAGALGVLMVNSVDGFPAGMGGTDETITIPSMMTTKAIGTALNTDIGSGGIVSVVLSTDHPDSIFLLDPTLADTLSSFTSRGPARAGTTLKPDITAPGDTVFSTKSGSRYQGTNFSGTSMATPHVAGVMALLKEVHPTWTVAQLKALVMNTATHDLWTSTAHTTAYTPTRVGAGRVDAANATLSPVIAYSTTNPEQVSLSFGEQEVLGTQSFVKSLTINNTGTSAASYNVAFNQYYQNNPGLAFALLNASDAALTNPVTIAASGTLEIKLKITADGTALTRALDGTIAVPSARQRFSESGGYVSLTSTGANPTLRVPVHIAVRPASNMSTIENRIQLPPAATGTFTLTPSGTPVSTADDKSRVSIFELKGVDTNEPSSMGFEDEADLQYIGATTDYPFFSFVEAGVYFGIATYGKWDTSNSVEFDIYIDVNEDGTDDYVIFNGNQSLITGTTDDVMYTYFCDLSISMCDVNFYTNIFSGNTNTNLFNNNVIVLPVGLTSIGLVDGTNTDFNFYVVSYSREAPGAVDVTDIMSYDVAHQSFTAVNPATQRPSWTDSPAAPFTITYDKAAIAANDSLGLLLLHHHNATNTAQVLSFNFNTFLPVLSK